MNCEKCGKNPAAITYTEYSEGTAQKLRICAECAQRLGFDISERPDAPLGETPPPPLMPPLTVPAPAKLFGILSIKATIGPAVVGEPEDHDPRECPGCGMTGTELQKQPLFGCPKCYETFNDSLDPLFRRIHGAVQHRGRVPGGKTTGPVNVDELRRDLRSAIANEDFEEAARLRDRLRQAASRIERPRGPSGGAT